MTTPLPPALFAICIMAMVFCAAIFFIRRAQYRRWQKTTGTVTELIRRNHDTSDRNSVTFAPRVSFQTTTGVTMAFLSDVSSSSAPKVGDRVPVLYDPNDPQEATIDNFFFKHLFEFVGFSMGLVGVLIYVFQR